RPPAPPRRPAGAGTTPGGRRRQGSPASAAPRIRGPRQGPALITIHPVHDTPPMIAAAIIGVIPPVRSAVDASRLIELSASITALITGAPAGTRASAKTSS